MKIKPGMKKRLLEIAVGSGGGAAAGLTQGDNWGERLDNAMVGAGAGAGLAYGASHMGRNARAKKIMRGGYIKHSPFVDVKTGKRVSVFDNKESAIYMRHLTNKRPLSEGEAGELLRYMPPLDDSLMKLPKGIKHGGEAMAYYDDVAKRAQTYGAVKAMDDAYWKVYKGLRRRGHKQNTAELHAYRILYRPDAPVHKSSQRIAEEALELAREYQNNQFMKTYVRHNSDYLKGRVKPEAITKDIVKQTRKTPGLVTLSPKDKHLENPSVFKDITKVVDKLRDPGTRKGLAHAAGGKDVKSLLDETFFGFGTQWVK